MCGEICKFFRSGVTLTLLKYEYPVLFLSCNIGLWHFKIITIQYFISLLNEHPKANFIVHWCSTATAFTVLWENVSLQDQPNGGNFTFQVTLRSNGDIIFVYQHIPNITAELTDYHHPVKIGLSDAYIMDRTIFCKYSWNIRAHIRKIKSNSEILLWSCPSKNYLWISSCSVWQKRPEKWNSHHIKTITNMSEQNHLWIVSGKGCRLWSKRWFFTFIQFCFRVVIL